MTLSLSNYLTCTCSLPVSCSSSYYSCKTQGFFIKDKKALHLKFTILDTMCHIDSSHYTLAHGQTFPSFNAIIKLSSSSHPLSLHVENTAMTYLPLYHQDYGFYYPFPFPDFPFTSVLLHIPTVDPDELSYPNAIASLRGAMVGISQV